MSGGEKKRFYPTETDYRLKWVDPNGHLSEPQQLFWQSENKAYADIQTIKALFFSEDWVFTCVDAIAHPLSTLPLSVFKISHENGDEVKTKVDEHPVSKILKKPNKFQNRNHFLYSMAADYILAGNAYAWRGEAGGIYHIPAEQVVYGFSSKNALPDGYLIMTDSESGLATVSKKVGLADMAHAKRPNPSSAIYGLSPFVPGRRSILFNRYSAEYLNNFYLKGASPQFILEMDATANEKSITRLLASFESAYTGRRNQRRTLVLPKGVTAQPADTKIADQQLKDLILMNRENILATLRVPKHVVGLQESGSLGSEEHKQALKYFWQTTISDTAQAIAEAINAVYYSVLGDGYSVGFDLSSVEELRDDEMQKATLSRELLSVLTVNEVRKRIWKLPPVKGGDAVSGTFAPDLTLPTQSSEPQTVDQPGDQPVDQPEIQKTALNGAQVSSLVEVIQSVASGMLPRDSGLSIIQFAFQMTREEAETVMGESGASFVIDNQIEKPSEPQPQPEQPRNLIKNVSSFKFQDHHLKAAKEKDDLINKINERLFKKRMIAGAELITKQTEAALEIVAPAKKDKPNPKELQKKLKKAFDAMEQDYLDEAEGDLMQVVSLGYDMQTNLVFNIDAREALQAVKERDAKGRRKILTDRNLFSFQSVTDTNFKNVMKQVEISIQEGTGVNELAKNILDSMKRGFEWRASTIARTEIMSALTVGEQSVFAAARAAGVSDMKKVWLTSADDRVREMHKDPSVNGQIRDDAEPFDVGGEPLMYPRDPSGRADNTINCRCTVLMIPSGEIGDYAQDIADIQAQAIEAERE